MDPKTEIDATREFNEAAQGPPPIEHEEPALEYRPPAPPGLGLTPAVQAGVDQIAEEARAPELPQPTLTERFNEASAGSTEVELDAPENPTHESTLADRFNQAAEAEADAPAVSGELSERFNRESSLSTRFNQASKGQDTGYGL